MAVTLAPARSAVRRPLPRYAGALLILVVLGAVTTLPYLYAAWTTPADSVYTGLMLDAPDTLQYFSWLRDHRSATLVPNRMTSQPNEPALFNLLWLGLAQVQNLTGWSNAAIFQLLRVGAFLAFAGATWWLLGLATRTARERMWAWALAMCGSGLGIVWVVEKYARGLADVRFPFDLYVAEPNTLLMLLGYPHFLAAGALVIGTLAASLLAVRSGHWRWWALATALALLLSLQHAYDLLTIYGAYALWLVLLGFKQRRIPWRIGFGMALVGIVSFPPAGYFYWLTSRDPMWREVLSQFSNANVWTPNLLHLPILMGLPLIVAVVGWDGFRPLRSRPDGELLIKAWAIAGLVLIYLPVNFQIHLLMPWQVPLALLAVWGVERRIRPWAARRMPRLARWMLPALLLLSLPTNLYLVAWRYIELGRHERPWYLHVDEAQALSRLAERATPEDVVLSELELGQYVPAETDARAVLAHWAQTVDFYTTRDDVAVALAPETSPQARAEILRRYGVTYVLAPEPLDDPALKPIFAGERALLYAVGQEQ